MSVYQPEYENAAKYQSTKHLEVVTIPIFFRLDPVTMSLGNLFL